MASDDYRRYQKRKDAHGRKRRLAQADPPTEVGTSSRRRSDWLLELFVGTATLLLATLAYLITSPALGALALVSGGVSYGILIARRRDRQ